VTERLRREGEAGDKLGGSALQIQENKKINVISSVLLYAAPVAGVGTFCLFSKGDGISMLSNIVITLILAGIYYTLLHMNQDYLYGKIYNPLLYFGCLFLSFVLLGGRAGLPLGIFWMFAAVIAALDSGLELALSTHAVLMVQYAVLLFPRDKGFYRFSAYILLGIVVALLFSQLMEKRAIPYLILILLSCDGVLQCVVYQFNFKEISAHSVDILVELFSLLFFAVVGYLYLGYREKIGQAEDFLEEEELQEEDLEAEREELFLEGQAKKLREAFQTGSSDLFAEGQEDEFKAEEQLAENLFAEWHEEEIMEGLIGKSEEEEPGEEPIGESVEKQPEEELPEESEEEEPEEELIGEAEEEEPEKELMEEFEEEEPEEELIGEAEEEEPEKELMEEFEEEEPEEEPIGELEEEEPEEELIEEQQGEEQVEEELSEEEQRAAKLWNFVEPGFELLEHLKEYSEDLYLHSERIALLSEKAARAVGGNAVLAKAGGFYHEIGHIEEKENYIEAGIRIGREYGFPEELLAVIRQHSTSFELPKSVEAAIVMLSDCIISTSDFLAKSGKREKVSNQKLVTGIFQNRLEKGNLEQSGMTEEQIRMLRDFYIENTFAEEA